VRSTTPRAWEMPLISGVALLVGRGSAGQRAGRGRPAEAPPPPRPNPPDRVALEDVAAALASWRVLGAALACGLAAVVLLPWFLVFVVFDGARNPVTALTSLLVGGAFLVGVLASLLLLLGWVLGRIMTGTGEAWATAGGAALGYVTGELPLLLAGAVLGCVAGAVVVDAYRAATHALESRRRNDGPSVRAGESQRSMNDMRE
jgi:hypothetical protein